MASIIVHLILFDMSELYINYSLKNDSEPDSEFKIKKTDYVYMCTYFMYFLNQRVKI